MAGVSSILDVIGRLLPAFRVDIIQRSLLFLLQGAWMTLRLTTLAVFFGIIIGTFVGIARVSKGRLISLLAAVYVDFLRGTPLLVQIFLIHMGLPQLIGSPVPPYISALSALSINSGAYVAEIIRAGIQSIHRGQMEAARSLGMSYAQAMRYVILPQAFRRIIPPLGNEFIALLKDSSLVSVIAMEELVRKGQIVIGRTFRPFEIWTMVAIMYLVMTVSISRLVAFTEKKLHIPH
ncbi:MAG TPA: amino acid ABC transporter permease [Firmicutes bacterium]|nr:amino acid ABC transporter permease [Bacillota bacterium]HHY98067.1 amino acid ABC transporter permease [Bacillota bacterium]